MLLGAFPRVHNTPFLKFKSPTSSHCLPTSSSTSLHRMGLKFSSTSPNLRTAKVIAADGSLREFSIFLTVSDVLGSHYTSRCLCNSDSLTYNSRIPVLHLDESLQPGKLYFILPVEILGSPLTGPDMAALAAKALSALNSRTVNRCYRKPRKFQFVPVSGKVDGTEVGNEEDVRVFARPRLAQRGVGRAASLRARPARFSSKVKLSTIDEVPE